MLITEQNTEKLKSFPHFCLLQSRLPSENPTDSKEEGYEILFYGRLNSKLSTEILVLWDHNSHLSWAAAKPSRDLPTVCCSG